MSNTEESDYLKYRGKCKEFCEALLRENSTLILVRGYYYDPVWGEQAHWWCKKADGTIVDPTKDQFPSKGKGTYVEFDGYVSCSECGQRMPEEDGIFESRYVFCSNECYTRFVGIPLRTFRKPHPL